MSTLSGFLLARIAEDETDARSSIYSRQEIPRRLLAECEAKRQVVAEHVAADHCLARRPYEPVPDWTCATLRALTLPYRDHPDYQQEWKP